MGICLLTQGLSADQNHRTTLRGIEDAVGDRERSIGDRLAAYADRRPFALVSCPVAIAKPEPSSIVSDMTLPAPPMNAPDLALADAFLSAPSTNIVPACEDAVP